MSKITFGDFFRARRLKLGLTLRSFSAKNKLDPAYVSRLENNFMKAPEDKKKLELLALSLEIAKASRDWVNFFDLAAASRKTIPEDLVESNPNVMQFLPAFFRTARKKNVDKADINNLLNIIKGGA